MDKLLPLWGNEVGIDDALELLGPGFTNSKVRAFAVKRLAKADDEVSSLPLRMSPIIQRLWDQLTCEGARPVLAPACAGAQI